MRRKFALISILLLALIPLFGVSCSGQINASDYAPIFYFEAEETCYPIDASYHLDNSDYICVNEFLEETCFYDNTHGTINDEGVINHYQSVMSTYGYTVYYQTFSSETSEIIQYWMFYVFNKGELNQHEGDWEMVQIVFENDEPTGVAYSQHHSGQKATWSQVEKEGNHIKVYVARGSHANYLRSFSGKIGIASDIVGANGKVLKPSDYTLDDLEDETWLNFTGRWGEAPDTEASALEAEFLGQAGPNGPKYREDGAMWDGASWGNSLFPANDMMFMAEWFFYNFILIFIIITIVILALMAFRIYRRHKKYGLGPRIVSMLYIKGLNLHSIGNILCIVGIILAFIGLFNPWYFISYEASGSVITGTSFQTEGIVNLLSFDGLNGLHVTIPGASGPIPMGSFVLPFSVFIAIGLIFMIIATIGIPLSKKLGTKYIWRGVRLLIPFILILVLILAIGSIVPSMAGGGQASSYIQDIIDPLASSPFGGQSSTSFDVSGGTAQINLQWGLGLGAWLLLFAGIIILVSGILEIIANSQFFVTKIPLPGKALTRMPAQHPPLVQQQPPQQQAPQKQASPKEKSKVTFCTECGAELGDKATFCTECGKKLK